MSLWIGVALFLTVWATIAITVALIVGRAARLRDEKESVDALGSDPHVDDLD